MSEAHEGKALLVLDAGRGWAVAEAVPLELGPRHFRARSLAELQAALPEWRPRQGDRVQVRVSSALGARGALAALEEAGALGGAAVEVREAGAEGADAPAPRIENADTLAPRALLARFFEEGGGARHPGAPRALAEALLEEVLAAAPAGQAAARAVSFEEVELEGYGSFGRTVRYPLRDRGLVMVLGRNEDPGAADSNGSGKTTLCMAALWALTGSADVRADGKRLGRRDVIHAARADDAPWGGAGASDDAGGTGGADAGSSRGASRRGAGAGGGGGVARVSLRLDVDGAAVVVERSVTGEAHQLRVWVAGEEVTRSTLRETQAELERRLPLQVLADSVFHGQHLVRGLLEKTDKDFKAALDSVVPSHAWTACMDEARARRRAARARAEVVAGRILEKEGEAGPLRARAAAAEARARAWEQARGVRTAALRAEAGRGGGGRGGGRAGGRGGGLGCRAREARGGGGGGARGGRRGRGGARGRAARVGGRAARGAGGSGARAGRG